AETHHRIFADPSGLRIREFDTPLVSSRDRRQNDEAAHQHEEKAVGFHATSLHSPLCRRNPAVERNAQIPAKRRRYLSATSNSLGNGASIVSGSRETGCFTVNRLACSASRVINGFSSARPL